MKSTPFKVMVISGRLSKSSGQTSQMHSPSKIMATKSTVNSLDSTARTSDEGCACINDSRAAVTAYVSAINGEGLHVNRPIGSHGQEEPKNYFVN